MKIRGTDFVMYPVSDLAKAAQFYRETLGLSQEVYSEPWQWAEFDCGNVTLALHGGAKPAEEMTGGQIARAVEDIHVTGAELKSQGARVLGEPTYYPVCWALKVLDPDGGARPSRSPPSASRRRAGEGGTAPERFLSSGRVFSAGDRTWLGRHPRAGAGEPAGLR